jgi:hypothetical protein
MIKRKSDSRGLRCSILPLDAQLNLPWEKYFDGIHLLKQKNLAMIRAHKKRRSLK